MSRIHISENTKGVTREMKEISSSKEDKGLTIGHDEPRTPGRHTVAIRSSRTPGAESISNVGSSQESQNRLIEWSSIFFKVFFHEKPEKACALTALAGCLHNAGDLNLVTQQPPELSLEMLRTSISRQTEETMDWGSIDMTVGDSDVDVTNDFHLWNAVLYWSSDSSRKNPRDMLSKTEQSEQRQIRIELKRIRKRHISVVNLDSDEEEASQKRVKVKVEENPATEMPGTSTRQMSRARHSVVDDDIFQSIERSEHSPELGAEHRVHRHEPQHLEFVSSPNSSTIHRTPSEGGNSQHESNSPHNLTPPVPHLSASTFTPINARRLGGAPSATRIPAQRRSPEPLSRPNEQDEIENAILIDIRWTDEEFERHCKFGDTVGGPPSASVETPSADTRSNIDRDTYDNEQGESYMHAFTDGWNLQNFKDFCTFMRVGRGTTMRTHPKSKISPQHLSYEPYFYQWYGAYLLLRHGGSQSAVIHGDKPGLGKTLMALLTMDVHDTLLKNKYDVDEDRRLASENLDHRRRHLPTGAGPSRRCETHSGPFACMCELESVGQAFELHMGPHLVICPPKILKDVWLREYEKFYSSEDRNSVRRLRIQHQDTLNNMSPDRREIYTLTADDFKEIGGVISGTRHPLQIASNQYIIITTPQSFEKQVARLYHWPKEWNAKQGEVDGRRWPRYKVTSKYPKMPTGNMPPVLQFQFGTVHVDESHDTLTLGSQTWLRWLRSIMLANPLSLVVLVSGTPWNSDPYLVLGPYFEVRQWTKGLALEADEHGWTGANISPAAAAATAVREAQWSPWSATGPTSVAECLEGSRMLREHRQRMLKQPSRPNTSSVVAASDEHVQHLRAFLPAVMLQRRPGSSMFGKTIAQLSFEVSSIALDLAEDLQKASNDRLKQRFEASIQELAKHKKISQQEATKEMEKVLQGSRTVPLTISLPGIPDVRDKWKEERDKWYSGHPEAMVETREGLWQWKDLTNEEQERYNMLRCTLEQMRQRNMFNPDEFFRPHLDQLWRRSPKKDAILQWVDKVMKSKNDDGSPAKGIILAQHPFFAAAIHFLIEKHIESVMKDGSVLFVNSRAKSQEKDVLSLFASQDPVRKPKFLVSSFGKCNVGFNMGWAKFLLLAEPPGSKTEKEQLCGRILRVDNEQKVYIQELYVANADYEYLKHKKAEDEADFERLVVQKTRDLVGHFIQEEDSDVTTSL